MSTTKTSSFEVVRAIQLRTKYIVGIKPKGVGSDRVVAVDRIEEVIRRVGDSINSSVT